jgi:hypothetical protein
MSDDEIKPLNIEKSGFEKHDNNRQSRSESLNNKSKSVFKITSDNGFEDDFFDRLERTSNAKMRTGQRIQGPNSNTRAKIERVDETDEELIDFVQGRVNSVGISQGEGVLMQRISFNKSSFKDKEMNEWLNDRGLQQELTESDYFNNYKDTVLISENSFHPSEWRLYSFKNDLKVIAGYFANY